jgi:purine-binding chemotaxis protein CheW
VDSEDGIQQLGVLVDAVNEVLEIPATDVEPPPSFGVHIRNEFIRGMGKIGERFVILLDVSRTFSVDELAGLASVAAGEADILAA